MNRFVRKLALPVCFVLLAGAACGGGDDDEGASGGEGGGSKKDITVGAIFDLSGATADVGTPFSVGIRDYVEYRNSQGGVEGHKIDLRWQDYGYKVPSAEQLYGQFVSEGAKVFMGWGTGDTEALRPKVNADQVPFMSASLAETLTDPKETPYNFFPAPSYSQQMRIALQYIADQNQGSKTEVAVFHHDSPFGVSPLEDGNKYISSKKLDINMKSYAMPGTATDFIAQIGQAKAQGAKYIIIQNVASPAAKLAQNLKSQNSTAQIICLNWCADELFVKLAGPGADKVIGVMPYSPPVNGTPGLEQVTEFLKTKNTDPAAKGIHYVQGWFFMATMVEGISNALKEKPDGDISGPDIKAGLEKIRDFKTGVSDPITFTPEYHAGMEAAPLYQVENGAFKKIADPIKVEH